MYSSSSVVRRMDCNATFGYFKNIRRKAFLYLSMRWLRAYLSRRRVVRRCTLKHVFRRVLMSSDGVVSSSSSGGSVWLSASSFRIRGMPSFGGSV